MVTVITTETSGLQAFGGGFVSSSQGDVLTCYHVIEGARRVRIFYNGKLFEAAVTGIAPDRDTARLRLLNVPTPTEYLQKMDSPPPEILSKPLTIVGYTAGLFDQQIRATATQDHFAGTAQMKGLRGETLFASNYVRVIPITTTIYKGMSGSPVITSNGAVVGLISGSLNQGGALAWAIAIENANSEHMRSPPSDGTASAWPPLSLMASGWDNLRRQTPFGQELLDKILALQPIANQLNRDSTQACYRAKSCKQAFSNLLGLFTDSRFDQVDLSGNVPASWAEWIGAFSSRTDVANVQLSATGADIGTLADLVSTGVQRYNELISVTNSYVHGLPPSDRNVRLSASISDWVRSTGAKATRISAGVRASIRPVRPRSGTSYAAYREFFQGIAANLDPKEGILCELLPEFTALLQQADGVFRQLLGADIVGEN